MEVDSGIERAPVINEEFNTVTLVDAQRGTRKLAIRRNHWTRYSCDGSVTPCQSDWKEHRSRRCPLNEA